MLDAAAGERFEEAAQLRDAMRTVQTLHDRQQKMATVGARASRRLRPEARSGRRRGPGLPGAERPRRRARRARHRRRRSSAIERRARCSRRRSSSSTSCAPRRRRSTCRRSPTSARRSRRWLSERAGRRVRIVVPQRGEKRGLVDLATRNAALAYQTRFNQATAAQYDALETLQAVLGAAGAAAPHRVLRHLDDSGQRDGGVDGGVRGRPDAAGGVSEVPDQGGTRGYGDWGLGIQDSTSEPPSLPVPSPRSPNDFAAMHEVVLRRYRKLLEQGGPFPDLIVIDGGKGQLSAAYAALEELGLANLVAVGIAKKEELLFTRDRDEPIALAPNDPALLLIQRIRDEAHRFAVTFHRQARTMRDLRSELDDVPGIGPRRRQTLLTTFGSLAGVRRATREELAAAVGPKVADAVLAFFASRP